MQSAKKTNLLDILKEEKKQRENKKKRRNPCLAVSTDFKLTQAIEEFGKDHIEEPKTPEFTISNSDDQDSFGEFSGCGPSGGELSCQIGFAKENDSKDKKKNKSNSSFPTSMNSDGLKTTGETFQSETSKGIKRSTNLIDLARKPENNSSSFL